MGQSHIFVRDNKVKSECCTWNLNTGRSSSCGHWPVTQGRRTPYHVCFVFFLPSTLTCLCSCLLFHLSILVFPVFFIFSLLHPSFPPSHCFMGRKQYVQSVRKHIQEFICCCDKPQVSLCSLASLIEPASRYKRILFLNTLSINYYHVYQKAFLYK